MDFILCSYTSLADIQFHTNVMLYVFSPIEPEIPDIQEEEGAEGEGGEQAQGETNATAEDAEPKEQALGVSTPTGAEEDTKKG